MNSGNIIFRIIEIDRVKHRGEQGVLCVCWGWGGVGWCLKLVYNLSKKHYKSLHLFNVVHLNLIFVSKLLILYKGVTR